MVSVFDEILLRTIYGYCHVPIIIILIVALLLLFDFIWYKQTKSKEGFLLWKLFPMFKHVKGKHNLKQQVSLEIICIIFIVIAMLMRILPIVIDIEKQQYQQIDAFYFRDSASKDSIRLLSNGTVTIKHGNDEFTLELPNNWTKDEFPVGNYFGTIWYSLDSRIILHLDIIESCPELSFP